MTPTRVAVLGGGAGALAAAFELTERLGRDVEVTVYTRGWRLGGKGASGRDASHHHRIEEHGLHLWFGFYDEAIDLMRDAYRLAGTDAPAVAWHDMFAPVPWLGLWDGPDTRYRLHLPTAELDAPRPKLRVRDRGEALGDWLVAVWEARREDLEPSRDIGPPPPSLVALAEGLGATGGDTSAATAGFLENAYDEATAPTLGVGDLDPQLVALLDLFAAVFRRMAESGLLDGRGRWRADKLAAIDVHDFRDWLALEREETQRAPFLRALYDLVFAYPGGVREPTGEGKPPGEIAAGVAVRSLLRIVTEHRGTCMLRMLGGMGDVVFAPLYFALRARGVRFAFFHHVEALQPEDGRIARIHLVSQAGVRSGEYRPMTDRFGGQWAWPNTPHWEQLDVPEGERPDFERCANPLGREPFTLERGEHFDEVVLGLPPNALGDEGNALAAADARFGEMRDGLRTVATQALQLWLTTSSDGAGLARDAGSVTGGDAPPFDTYADVSHVLDGGVEPWPAGSAVRGVAYFCGVLPEADAQAEDPHAAVEAHAAEFLRARPALRDALADGDGDPTGSLGDQYCRANTHGSERYVLSAPGTIAHRLPPGDARFSNLTLAGDWTDTRINAGCIEAAVASGRAAAIAIVARGGGGGGGGFPPHRSGRPEPSAPRHRPA